MKKNIYVVFLITSAVLTSCAFPHYYYSPNIQNVPLFREANEFSGLVAGSFSGENNSLEIQTAYAFPANIALMANYMTGGKSNSVAPVTDYSKSHYFDGAIGYYTSLGDIGSFEIYGGYGQGSQSHVFARNEYMGGLVWNWKSDGNADLLFSKFFIQPDIGIKKGWLEASFSTRVSKLNFKEINVFSTEYHLDELNLLKEYSNPWLIEPVLTFRAGGKSVKGQLQLVFSKNLANPDLMFETTRFTIGLHFNISKKPPVNQPIVYPDLKYSSSTGPRLPMSEFHLYNPHPK